ncbi:unnamed protein product [Durusdinium trenchii]|uniref:Small-subunit processome Utp12 domain-containing protein n=1 Tax=Durusdinium trenchii TaxID=1381693 RepID=A0ABP0R081_9DINO
MAGPKGALFGPEDFGTLLVHAGGRWKLWREREGSVDLHHNDDHEIYSVACWVKEKSQGHCLVLGCNSGRVQIWNAASAELVARGEAFRKFAHGQSAGVAALAAAPERRGTFFAASRGTVEIMEVGILDGMTRSSFKSGKIGACALAVASGKIDWLLSASWDATPLKLWRLPEPGAELSNLKKAEQRLRPPGNMVTAADLCSVGKKLYALCADGTTQVEVFDISSSAEPSKTPMSSSRVLSCHERIVSAAFAPGGETDTLRVTAHGTTLVVCWSFDRGVDSSTRTVMPVFTVSKAELGGSILATRGPSSLQLQLLLAHGPSAQPRFSLVSPPKSKKATALIEPLASTSEKSTVAGTDEKKRVAAEEPTAVPETLFKRAKLEGKPKALTAKVPLPKSRSAAEGSHLSLAPVLRQGLRAQDTKSLTETLHLHDRSVMDTSVSELNGVEAFDLLQECARRVRYLPEHTTVYCAWIQRIVQHHGSFLRSQPVLADETRYFYDHARLRCAMYRHLLRIRGRLLHAVNEGQKVVASKDEVIKPLLEYVEGDEDLEEEASEEKLRDSDNEDGDLEADNDEGMMAVDFF